MVAKKPDGRPLLFEAPEALQASVDAYFADRAQAGKPVTMSGLALWLNVCRKTVINYEGRQEFTEIIQRARGKVEEYAEEALYGRETARGAQFSLQNNFDWREKTDNRLSGPDGGPLKAETSLDMSGLSLEQLKALASIPVNSAQSEQEK